MSLCPSSSHQLVAAAIAFRRARRKFPKDFGLESTSERISGNTKAETATSCEGSINQAKSSSMLMRRACNSKSDHVYRDYDHHSYSKDNSINCSCCRARNNSEDISELQDECSGGDAIDTVPSREHEEFVASEADHKDESVKVTERDRCEVYERGGKAQHKSWHDQMRGENSRLYARQCCSKEHPGIISASRKRNDEKRWERKNGNENDDNDEDGSVTVINHKDSMCILAEKYKVGRKCRGRRCGDKVRSADRTKGGRDRAGCNKSLTSKIIDQPESPLENAVPHGRPSVKHVCRAHCECCGTAARIASDSCSRGCGRHAPPEGEFDRFKPPLNETTATHRCSSRAPCRRAF
ncbi:uncharacterized protein LOC114934567 [Nylanderia fulva]|uniref:uncharacterized protein LOC114934567 n=1 Tax=Nylanderia fulva TaxID=613905 RepID=UPI0010FBB1C8|nr:uncharacterized protein LOC114934567 [Nylanderia fulva]